MFFNVISGGGLESGKPLLEYGMNEYVKKYNNLYDL
jgi:hypothetical protein